VESLKLAAAGRLPLDQAFLEKPQPIPADTSVNDLIGLVAEAPCQVPVVDENNVYLGLISKADLLQTLDRNNTAC
jgi:glycine betaine/proline transport system ATP-binding protein